MKITIDRQINKKITFEKVQPIIGNTKYSVAVIRQSNPRVKIKNNNEYENG